MRAGAEHYKSAPGDNHLREEVKQEKQEKPAKRQIPDYTKYPREFITYKWYRPIVTGIVFFCFYFIFNIIMVLAVGVAGEDALNEVAQQMAGGYDTMDIYNPLGAIVGLGGVATFIPALAIGNKIAGRRTFKSYESSRGNGWDFGIFFKTLFIGMIVVAAPIIVDYLIEGETDPVNRFTTAGIVTVAIIGPMQCIAEEYVFRGLIMQAVGSWFKIPFIAIVLPSVVFAAAHPYNWIGVVEIFVSGCFFGIVAWASRGIEASSALHICNNMAIFYMTGFGYGKISSQAEVSSLIFTLVVYGLYTIIILIMRKRGSFDKVKGNDAAKYNAKIEKKRAKKQAKRDKRDAKAAQKEIRKIEKSGAKHAAMPAVEPVQPVDETLEAPAIELEDTETIVEPVDVIE